MHKTYIIRKTAETAVFTALAVALDLIFDPILRLPNGGHLSPAMVPLLIIAFRYGGITGIICGVTYGFINYVLGGHPSLLYDYILAFGVIGIAGFFKEKARSLDKCYFICLFVFVLRLACHILSGVIIWKTPFIPSLTYNFTYLFPSMILTLVIITVLHHRGLIYGKLNATPRKEKAQ